MKNSSRLLLILGLLLVFMSNKCARTGNGGGFTSTSGTFQYPDSSDRNNDDVFVLCKRAKPCDDGTFEDAVVSKKACRQMLAMQEITQCKVGFGQKIDPYKDVGCTCEDVCPMSRFYNQKMNVLDESGETLSVQDLYEPFKAPESKEDKYKLFMGLNDINHKLSTYLQFDKSGDAPKFNNEADKIKYFKKAIKSAMAGKVSKLSGYKGLNDAVKKSPELRAVVKDELEAIKSEGTGELNKRWQKVKAKDDIETISKDLNLKKVEENLSLSQVTSHKKVTMATASNNMIVGTIVPYGDDEPFKKKVNPDGSIEKTYCVMRTDIKTDEENKCSSEVVRTSEGMKLMPSGESIGKLYLDDSPKDEQMAYDKSLLQNCYNFSGCRSQEDRMEDFNHDSPALASGAMNFTPAGRSNKGEEMVDWNECGNGGGITGSYVGSGGRSKCSKRRMSKEFSEFLNGNVQKCVNLALAKIGKKPSASLHMDHKGILADTRHSSRSNHSVGRAIDIASFEVQMEDGSKKLLKYSEAKKSGTIESKFFPQFRACWGEKMKQAKSSCPGRDPKGTIGHEDHAHKHHLHLSLPYCPRKGRYYVK